MNIKSILILLVLAFTLNACTSPTNEKGKEQPTQWPDAQTINQKIGRGINLGNALEAPNEGDWGVVLQPDYFKAIAQAGFNSVRIPIRWSNHALADLLAELVAYMNWVTGKAGLLRAELKSVEDAMSLYMSTKMESLQGSEASKKRQVERSLEYINLRRRRDDLKLKLKLIEDGIIDAVDKDWKTVSRAITIRTSEEQAMRRDDSVQNYRRTPRNLDKLVAATSKRK